MNKFSFTQLDRWREFHDFRSGPPPADLNDLFDWIHALHVPSPHEPQFVAGLERVMRHHRGTNECWLGVSGASHLGKTQAVTNVLLVRVMSEPQRWRTRAKAGGLHTPYVYVELGSSQETRGLLALIARACGLPDEGREKDLHQMLTRILPELGVRLIIVDESQMLRRSSDNASRLTDGLRTLLHLPVPFVFVGIDLQSSALLRRSTRNNDTALQLERRHIPLQLQPLRREEPHHAARLIGHFKTRIAQIPDLDLNPGLSDPNVLSFALAACEGRPGSLLCALKRAVIEAIASNNGKVTSEIIASEVDLQLHLERGA